MIQNIRRLTLTGAHNVRDLGGYAAGESGRTVYGRLLRADSLHDLTDRDVRLLLDYGVRTIVDLREPGEAAQSPGRLDASLGVRVHQVPLLAALAPALGGALPTDLGDTYVLCARHCHAALRRVFELLAAAVEGAALFHCMVGKDRTGVVAALLLGLVEAPREAILADYAASGPFLQPLVDRLVADYRRDPTTGVHPDFLVCDPANMARLLDTLREEHGGAEAYLRGIGVPARSLDRLKANLLGASPAPEPAHELAETRRS